MAITSLDIQNQSFSIDRKGYDVDEVDIFLEHVAEEIDLLNERISQLEGDLQNAKDDLALAQDGASSDVVSDPFAPATTPETADTAMETQIIPAQSADTEEASAQQEEQEKRINELEKQLSEKRANDSAISQALIIAQRTADDTIARAEVEAATIIEDAKKQAEDIVSGANADKQDIINESKQLDVECEEIRERFQGMLKDFINDATTKLADISDSSLMAGAHARRTTYDPNPAIMTATQGAQSYVTPTIEGNEAPVQVVAVPAQNQMPERDLSGFGDAAIDDDIEIDD